MIYFNEIFRNYEEFKALFGIHVSADGRKNRMNKILLNHLKSRELLRWCIRNENFWPLKAKTMAALKIVVMLRIQECSREEIYQKEGKFSYCDLMGKRFYSRLYETDDRKGLCEDFDHRAVRYVNIERARVYKMKAGKLFMALARENSFGRSLHESVLIWLAEEFSSEWMVHTGGLLPGATLHVDQNFRDIYSSDTLDGSFGSCMVDDCQYHFYQKSVDASAAYLTSAEGYIIARAIIFNDVTDEQGNRWRLCERQYSRSEDQSLKRMLVDQLIKGGYIDGYKQVGVDCHNSRAYVANDGTDLSEKKFRIECNLNYGDTLSYQDSFKWYNMDRSTAYNYEANGAYEDLAVTDPVFRGDMDTCPECGDMFDPEDYSFYSNLLDQTFCCEQCMHEAEQRWYQEHKQWDSWHEEWVDETVEVYSNGSEYYCDVYALDDFVLLPNGEYHHAVEVDTCPECGDWFLIDSSEYSVITNDDYCCEACRQKAEERILKEEEAEVAA